MPASFTSILSQASRLAASSCRAWALVVATAAVLPALDLSQWHLTFADEFDGTAFDASKWIIGEPWGAENAGATQAFIADDCIVANGMLRLKGERRQYKNFAFTSGGLNTFGKYSQRFGYFEMRARIPAGRGIWPAFWLLENSGPMEIDAMEVLGHEPGKVYFTNHWQQFPDRFAQGSFSRADLSKDFHTYSVEWNTAAIVYYLDGVERFRSVDHIPQQPMELLVQLQVGGDWPGMPDASTPFPGFMDVDYVRAYQPGAASGGNLAPVVSLTSPSAGARYAAGSTIAIAADAKDGDGSVVKLEWLANGGLIYSQASAPWSMNWVGVPAGTYVLTARATDNTGASTTSNAISVTVAPAQVQGSTPFLGKPARVPGTVQAEYFDDGGEGVGYHDVTPANEGGAFRGTGVDLDAIAGGYALSWTRAGEWLSYGIDVGAAGSYTLSARVACSGPGGMFHIACDGSDVTGAIAIPDTGGWATWRTISRSPIALPAGQHRLALVIDATGPSGFAGNIDEFTILDPAAQGTGLFAEYFSDQDLAQPALVRTDATVDFDWGAGSPGVGIPSDHFSARWSGHVRPGATGDHTLWVTSDDGVRMWIDGRLVIDRWTSHAPADDAFTMWMEAGRLYDVRLEYFENTGGAVARLSWSTSGYPRHFIEPAQLFPSRSDASASEKAGAADRAGHAGCGLGAGIGMLAGLVALVGARRRWLSGLAGMATPARD